MQHDQPLPRRTDRARRRGTTASTRASLILPALLVAGIVLLVAWRAAGAPPDGARGGAARDGAAVAPISVRTWKDVELGVPAAWVTLSRGPGHVTWGAADRAHTVTLGAAPASVLPLPGVVRGAIRAAAAELPGTAAGELSSVDVDRAPAGDTAVAASFRIRVPGGAGADGLTSEQTLQVQQVWRRDTAGDRDLIATWTSIDGRWPARPTRHVPRPTVR